MQSAKPEIPRLRDCQLTRPTTEQHFRQLLPSAGVSPAASTLPIVVQTFNPTLSWATSLEGSQLERQSQELAQAISVALILPHNPD